VTRAASASLGIMETMQSTERRPLERLWPWPAAGAAAAAGVLLGMWGVLRSPGGGSAPDFGDPRTWWRVMQVAAVLGVLLWVGLLAWRRHGPPPGNDRPPLENGLVAFGVPFGCVMGIHQALLHVGGFALDVLGREAFWWGLASGLTISLPIALWAGAVFGRFLKKRKR
jgi:hypothetical protein